MTKRHFLFVALCLGIAAAHAGVLRALFDLGSANPTASHHILIPAVCAVLLYIDRGAIFGVRSTQPAWSSGLAVVIVSVAMILASPFLGRETLTFTVAAMCGLWTGAFLLCYGTEPLRAAMFPLLFLAFTIPLPSTVIQAITHLLKAGSADTVAALFTLIGTPYHRDAFTFSLPTVAIEIADECSGIRSSIALMLTSLLGGHMFLRRGSTKLALLLAVIPFAILKNAIRIVSLSLLAVHVNPSFLSGRLHDEGGIVFFLLTLALMTPFFILLQRADRRRSRAQRAPSPLMQMGQQEI